MVWTDVAARMAALEAENERLSQAMDALMGRCAALEEAARAQVEKLEVAPPPTLPYERVAPERPTQAYQPWHEAWRRIVNAAFVNESSPEGAAASIHERLRALSEEEFLIVDFFDVGEQQRDATYDVLAESARGCCLLIRDPQRYDRYAAYPFPAGGAWFLKGVDLIRRIYHVEGYPERTPAPILEVIEVSYVEMADVRSDAQTYGRVQTYKPVRKGRVNVQRQVRSL